MILAFDTATPATVVGVARDDGTLVAERRHDPAPKERPGHSAELLAGCDAAMAEAGTDWSQITRLGVGTGPGTFTGLRIAIATAHGLAQALAHLELVSISTLAAVGGQAAVIDARRGEAFVAAWRDGEQVLGPVAWRPERLPELRDLGIAEARADAIFADVLTAAGIAVVPARVEARALVALTAAGNAVARVEPTYVRDPDAKRGRAGRT